MSRDTETRLSIIDGRLSRLNFLALCAPFLFLLNWLLVQQLQTPKVPAFLFGKVVAALIAGFCMLAGGRWRDYGTKVDAPQYFFLFTFVVFILFTVNCVFYNLSILLMLAFLVISAALPPEDNENDYGVIPQSSFFGFFIALPFSIASCFYFIKSFFQVFFVRVNCG